MGNTKVTATMDMRYEILESLPTYGPMYIPVTEDGEPFYSQGLAVRFFRDDNSDWVANFKPSWTGLNAIYEFDNQQNVLVIAGGTCYIMNPIQNQLKSLVLVMRQ